MKIVMSTDGGSSMNTNTKQDPSHLNTVTGMDRHGGGGGGMGPSEQAGQSSSGAQQNGSQQQPMDNMEYLKNLQAAMASADGNSNGNSGFNNNFQGPSSNTNNGGVVSNINFLQMRDNAGNDGDTVASSHYNAAARRISRDSIVSRESLSDMLGSDQLTSNNLAMMSMLANNANNTNNNSQQAQALNQSMSQLMMNSSLGMMGNNLSASWTAGGGNNLPMGALNGAFGMTAENSTSPLVIPPKKTKNKHKQTFAQKLMHILSIKECHNAIRWMPNGCAFCIVDSKELVEKILPKYFKEAKYSSFTRKLNRWGFKHFTLPSSEPNGEKEMSIYTHEKFLRDNPNLCQQMDGGHRRRNSQKESETSDSGAQGSSGLGGNDAQGNMNQMQQNAMMVQQLQQLQQQNLMMQQMQASMNQTNGMANQGNNMFNNNMSLNNMGGNALNTAMNQTSLPGGNVEPSGMRRTSLGFMPYLPQSNRRGSGFSVGGLSTISNDLANFGNEGGLDLQSIENFRRMSPTPAESMGNGATFDLKASCVTTSSEGSDIGPRDAAHSQAKLAVLEDMIAKEQRRQSLMGASQEL